MVENDNAKAQFAARAGDARWHKQVLVRNIGQIVTVDPCYAGPLGIVTKGAILFDEKIRWMGPEDQLPVLPSTGVEVIDAKGGVMTPGLVESHTHLLYAGSREAEFVQRVSGMTYQQISAAGGGILSTVRATRGASRDELLEIGLARLDSFLSKGITTVEIKSGYGLNTRDEIKMLEVIRELDRLHRVDVVSTFMAAHAVPPEYQARRSDYVGLIVKEMIPAVAERGLAEFCDVFCDELAFTCAETEAILSAARAHGMDLKVHAEQFSRSGGVAVAIAMGARSVEHLDHISADLEQPLAASEVVAVLTPGVNLFLGLSQWPPARRLLDSGVDVALSTDFSPGACMTENLPLMMTIACVRLGVRPEEALRATTLNAARALGRDRIVGSLAVGKQADAVIWAASSYEHLIYHFGVDHAMTVFKKGQIACTNKGPACFVQ